MADVVQMALNDSVPLEIHVLPVYELPVFERTHLPASNLAMPRVLAPPGAPMTPAKVLLPVLLDTVIVLEFLQLVERFLLMKHMQQIL